MKHSIIYSALIALACFLTACSEQAGEHAAEDHSSHGEKPIQHLKLADITSSAEAATVFAKEVAFITGKEALTAAALNEIHLSTYSLEKAVAYYAENSEGAKKELAEKIAMVVEEKEKLRIVSDATF